MFREMRRKRQQLPQEECHSILQTATSGVLAVAGDDDYPYAVPLSHKEIEAEVKKLRKEHPIDIPKELAYVEGKLFDDYIHDMKIIQGFAMENRKAMAKIIIHGLSLTPEEQFTTIHNYIDTDNMILRKGAVSAQNDEKLLIPINMRDGSLICIGKGNPDWNYSVLQDLV